MSTSNPAHALAVNSEGLCLWYCPGCSQIHVVILKGVPCSRPQKPWEFDGNWEKPTISPSILTQGTKRCHCFIRGGIIEYCDDCDHELAGKHVPLPLNPVGLATKEDGY